jgi:hypothetical protein
MKARLLLANGWTFSVAKSSTTPGYFSVVAWPTSEESAGLSVLHMRWHRWKMHGQPEAMVIRLDELIPLMAEVAALAPAESIN